jgi:hypothetical protein
MLLTRAKMYARKLATSASHQARPKRESTFMRVWVSEKAAYPIVAITLLAATMAAYKIYHTAMNPDYHFNRQERRTLDFLENDRDTDQIKDWSQNTIHKTPEIFKTLARAKGYIDIN